MIVVALFIVALVATMSYLMLARSARDTERTLLLIRATQAELYAQGSIAWAMDQLNQNWVRKKPNQIIDNMPMESPVNVINGYTISSKIYDMQARFNVNNLTDNNAQINFKHLLMVTDPKLSAESAQQIILAIVDWISPVTQENEFSKAYLQLAEPYRAAHRLMVSASELQLVRGITPALYAALKPNVIALPETTLLNVQTAAAPALTTLGVDISLESAQAIEQVRREIPIVSPQIFAGLDVVKNHQIAADKITVNSSYFLVATDVVIEKQHALIYTLLQRLANGDKATLRILWQSKSVWG